MAYEAKRFAENTSGVGKRTFLTIFYPYPEGEEKAIDSAFATVVDSNAIDVLKENFKEFGLQAIKFNPKA